MQKSLAYHTPQSQMEETEKTVFPKWKLQKKIAAALHKPLDSLLGITGNQNTVGISEEKSDVIHLYQKYQDIISVMEDFPAPLRESLRNTIIKFHSTYELMKK